MNAVDMVNRCNRRQNPDLFGGDAVPVDGDAIETREETRHWGFNREGHVPEDLPPIACLVSCSCGWTTETLSMASSREVAAGHLEPHRAAGIVAIVSVSLR